MLRDHYVSRWILRQWTHEGADDGALYVADLTAGTLEQTTPYRSFAAQDLHGAALEQRLNSIFEDPLSRFAQQFLNTKAKGLPSIKTINKK